MVLHNAFWVTLIPIFMTSFFRKQYRNFPLIKTYFTHLYKNSKKKKLRLKYQMNTSGNSNVLY